ncbi:hypothetical protein IY145_08490 [Methylosinus sp. H3A]|uniref:hypothetical protein n=1 Tax=Methylosinus sp. H3A TaxID=2785786 RepID=UPI0018C295C3|nr:hypothetical protein [Methylosinus sp. H3A]MBG0809415.1 hypothetical protein [Methylosinus sp. H3A]
MTENGKKTPAPAKKNAAALGAALRANLRRRKASAQTPRENGSHAEPEKRPPPDSQ